MVSLSEMGVTVVVEAAEDVDKESEETLKAHNQVICLMAR